MAQTEVVANIGNWLCARARLRLLAHVIVILAFGGVVQAAETIVVGDERVLGAIDKTTDRRNPAVGVAPDGKIFVGFVAVDGKHTRFAVTSSTDAGATFTQSITVSETTDNPTSGVNEHPRALVVTQEQIAFMWHDTGTGNDDHDLKISSSTDGGATFLFRRQLHSGRADLYQGGADIIVLGDSRLVSAWVDWRAGRGDPRVYGAISTDLGQTWTASDEPWVPQVSLQTEVCLVLDPRQRLYMTYRSQAEGDLHDPQWLTLDVPNKGAPIATDVDAIVKKGERWRTAPASGVAGCAFNDTGDMGALYRESSTSPKLVLAISMNRGANWKPPITIYDGEQGDPECPRLVLMPGGDVLAAWEVTRGSRAEIHLVRSSDQGKSFSKPVVIEGAGLALAARFHAEAGLIAAFHRISGRTSEVRIVALK